ncbi:MAG: DUF998 domain-containing protein [Exilibacterium sp.]
MKHGLVKAGYFSGLIVPLWLGIGVSIAGFLYPGYSHINQAMSELGAVGAPTNIISPVINNYPLGLLFIVFGISIWASFPLSKLAKSSALLIILHGIGSITAGYFSCDVGCNPETPSSSQVLHNLSSLVMFLSLCLAGFLWVYLSSKLLCSKSFAWFSLICTLIALAVLPAMASAIESGSGFGLYQRINYGVSVIWVAGLAYVVRKHVENQS